MELVIVAIGLIVVFTIVSRVMLRYFYGGFDDEKILKGMGDRHWERMNRYDGQEEDSYRG